MFKRINIMLPTYGRANTKLKTFIDTAKIASSGKEAVCFTFCVNRDDKETFEIIPKLLDGWNYDIILENLETPNLAKYFNMMYNQTKFNDPETLVSMLGDDMEFRTPDWDKTVLDMANTINGQGIIFCDDGFDNPDCFKMCVQIFTSRQYVEANKPEPFMNEQFPCDVIDLIWHHVAGNMHRYYYLPNVLIFHNHAVRSNLDETYIRLRKTYNSADSDPKNVSKIAEEQTARMIKNNPDLGVQLPIGIVMTCYDRMKLFDQTMGSLASSDATPFEIYCYDDGSQDAKAMEKIAKTDYRVKFFSDNEHLGVEKRNIFALEHFFANTKHDAAIVIDSDVIVSRGWYNAMVEAYNAVKDDEDFGALSILHDNANIGDPSEKYHWLNEKTTMGGCGLVVTRKFFKKSILPLRESGKSPWDNLSTNQNYVSGLKNYCTRISFIQHIGRSTGVHKGELASTGLNFIGNRFFVGSELAVDENVDSESALVFCTGRYGDIILSSIVANMIAATGIKVTALYIPYYADVAQVIYSKHIKTSIVKGFSQYNTTDWHTMSTSEAREMYRENGEYRYYLNLQPGSVENHDALMNSGMSMAQFVKARAESILDTALSDDWMGFLTPIEYKEPRAEIRNYDPSKPLLLVCNSAISIKPAIDNDKMREIVSKYDPDYNVKILGKFFRTSGGLDRKYYVDTRSFLDAMYLLFKAELFIGVDSGLTWAAMYNRKLKKIIYHLKERVVQTRMLYNPIDPMAEDIII